MIAGQIFLLEDGYDGGESGDIASKFADDWSTYSGSEPSQFQNHFNALCRLAGHDAPGDRVGSSDFAFNRVTPKADGSLGEADVFLRDRFVMEYKRPGRSLDEAYAQALSYRDSLGNPPLIIVSDFRTIRIHTNFTGTVSEVYSVSASDFVDTGRLALHRSALGYEGKGPLTILDLLRTCFHSPDDIKPTGTPESLTLEAATNFKTVADELAKWNPKKDLQIARFLSRILFIMFASDMKMLKDSMLTEVTRDLGTEISASFPTRLNRFMEKMGEGEWDGTPPIPRFNGGLFDGTPPGLERIDAIIPELKKADDLDWSQIEPSVFGTMFERVFNPEKRSQFGMHYTSRADIELLAEPVLMAPLRKEWDSLKKRIEVDGDLDTAKAELQQFVDHVGSVKVLDPACGSGNFLYVALSLLHGLERQVMGWALAHGIHPPQSRVHPRQLHGIEIDDYARELASVVIWIGHLQNNGDRVQEMRRLDPVLEPLDNIERRDAVVTEADIPGIPAWPEVDCIIGNPPFLGNKQMRRIMGDDSVDRLYAAWDGLVPNGADLCMYWFEKARQQIEAGRAKRAGLLGTQGIRYGQSRKVLERIVRSGGIFFAIPDKTWCRNDARREDAMVRISMVGFDDGTQRSKTHNGTSVSAIHPDLSCGSVDIHSAKTLRENLNIAFQGINRRAKFEIEGPRAVEWMQGDSPLRRRNREILKPIVIGRELNGEPRNKWLIDFGATMSFDEAKDYEAPFEYLQKTCEHARNACSKSGNEACWWDERPLSLTVRNAIAGLDRYLCTSHVAKHRIFTWLEPPALPEHTVVVFARDDDYFFGVLQSKPHTLWAKEIASQLRESESGSRYTHTTCFEKFPLPRGDEAIRTSVERAIRRIVEIRDERMADAHLTKPHLRKQHTLTGLYNDPPSRLVDAHAELDHAVFRAYGWSEAPGDLNDDEVLSRLLALNLDRAG